MSSTLGVEGLIAVITGGAQGVGAATARVFAENGVHLLLVDVKQDVLGQTTAALAKDFPSLKIHNVVCDLSNSAQVKELGHHYDKVFTQPPGIVVNNAAIVKREDWLDIEESDFDAVMNTNFKAIHLVSQVFARKAVAAKTPLSIINVASFTIHSGMGTIASYVAAKSAIVGLTKTLAKELGPKDIRVNAVLPGFIDTPMNSFLNDASRRDIAAKTPLGRMADPREIANPILFFASKLSSFCTGSLLDAHGGMTL